MNKKVKKDFKFPFPGNQKNKKGSYVYNERAIPAYEEEIKSYLEKCLSRKIR